MGASFSRHQGGPLWALEGGPSTAVVAFCPFEGVEPPATVSLAATWETYPGTYLVLPAGTSLDHHVADGIAWLRGRQPGHTLRCAWVAGPEAPAHVWDAATLRVSPSGQTEGVAKLGLRNLALWVGGGCDVAPNADGDALVITPPAAGPGRIALSAQAGSATIDNGGAAATIPFAGAQAGCLRTPLTLSCTAERQDLEVLDVGMRLFTPDARPPVSGRLRSWRFPVLAPEQPKASAALPVETCVDPVAPLDATRTYLGLAATDDPPPLASSYVSANGYPVSLTPLDDPPARLVLAVRALSDPPGADDPYTLVPSGAFAIAVEGGKGPGAARLLCGTSGIEYVTLPPNAQLWFCPGGDAVAGGKGLAGPASTAYATVVAPGQDAAAGPEAAPGQDAAAGPDAAPGQDAAAGPDAAPGQDAAAGPDDDAPVYRAQPDGSPLFAPGKDEGYLDYLELTGVPLAAPPDDGSLPAGFPLLPFSGLRADDLGTYQELEYQAVAPARRSLIGAAPSRPGRSLAVRARDGLGRAAEGGDATPAVTPQGLLAHLRADGTDLTLMRSQGGTHVLTLGASDALMSALQSSQLFLVGSDPASLQREGAEHPDPTVTIPAVADGSEMWTITAFPPDDWAANGTLLVFKFADKPLVELAADTDAWADPATFNPSTGGVEAAQQTLRAAIAEAEPRHDDDPEFEPFWKLAQDPAWQGILVLGCPIPPAALPKQLAGLAAGLDASDLVAHHLGVTVTPAKAAADGIDQDDSSMFGLLFYESPTTAAGAQGPYAFQVDYLKVRFANSAVASFSSRIELLVEELFGDPAALRHSSNGANGADGDDRADRAAAALHDPSRDAEAEGDEDDSDDKASVLLLDGVYQQQGSSPGYAFTSTKDNFFASASAVLDSVEVTSAQFVTAVAPDRDDPTKKAESRFVLAGSLRFKPSEAFDLFSYGPDKPDGGASPQQLAYRDLAIDLTYLPGDPTSDTYTFDASKIAIDASQSEARSKSLFARFPVTPTGLIQAGGPGEGSGDEPATPASLGYVGVEAPVGQGALGQTWFGLTGELDLGTPGALAAQAGLTAHLLAAWSPGTGTPNVAVGLKLPGTGSGGKLLSLQSVLKLQIGSVTLSLVDGTYLLALDRIALRVLALTFPPGGQIDALLFTDSDQRDHPTLGWFAGYAKTSGKERG